MENPANPNPEPSPQPAVAVAIDPAAEALKGEFLKGVGWFYWIGGLSIVNIGMGFVDHKFLFGLGVTELVDEIAKMGESTSLPLLALSVALSMGFVGLGHMGRKGKLGFILTGLILYALDAGLLVIAQDWLSVAFHGYAGYSIFKGYGALKRILAGAAA